VSQSPRRPRTGPPHNPGVRDLIAAKRRYSSPPNPQNAKLGFRGWYERGYLPHRDEPGLTQFVTFRLADTFPASVRFEWEHLWRIEDDHQRQIELEAYLDRGRGECYLRRPRIAQLVEGALLFFHAQRYQLRAWCVMPNHVHVLFKVDTVSMSESVESWKKYTAPKANRLLNRQGRFWEPDYWDTYMRDTEQERKAVHYIETNPCKAKLVLDPKDWHWSSARVRDELGALRL
jgi:REP-associated tyrosine transposase